MIITIDDYELISSKIEPKSKSSQSSKGKKNKNK